MFRNLRHLDGVEITHAERLQVEAWRLGGEEAEMAELAHQASQSSITGGLMV